MGRGRRIFYQRVVIQIVGVTISSLRQEAHQERYFT
jgi:hypothetical protein